MSLWLSPAQSAPTMADEPFQTFLPLATEPDPFEQWVVLGNPSSQSASVNYLYIDETCSAEEPPAILAATDDGLYQWNRSLPGAWQPVSISTSIQASHIIKTSRAGLFVASFDKGVWRSIHGQTAWIDESPRFPDGDDEIYWLSATNTHIFAAGGKGLYRRPNVEGNEAWTRVQSGRFYVVATSGDTVYGVRIGDTADTLLISHDAGTTWPTSAQLPGPATFIQTLYVTREAPSRLLIGAVNGGLYTLNGTSIIQFPTDIANLTVYGVWDDHLNRPYIALREPGGIRRFGENGGLGQDLSSLPNNGTLASERLYTVNGSVTCHFLGTASRSGTIWARRIPD